MPKVVLDIGLQRPYSSSFNTLLDFINIWNCDIIKIDQRNAIYVISINLNSYKRIWGEAPVFGFVEVPAGTEKFIKTINVVEF